MSEQQSRETMAKTYQKRTSAPSNPQYNTSHSVQQCEESHLMISRRPLWSYINEGEFRKPRQEKPSRREGEENRSALTEGSRWSEKRKTTRQIWAEVIPNTLAELDNFIIPDQIRLSRELTNTQPIHQGGGRSANFMHGHEDGFCFSRPQKGVHCWKPLHATTAQAAVASPSVNQRLSKISVYRATL
jgi:hypothetical protein